MAAHAIHIRFAPSASIDRVRDFAEALSLLLGELGSLPMAQADAAIDQLCVAAIRPRHIGQCQVLIKRVLKKHKLTDEALLELGKQ